MFSRWCKSDVTSKNKSSDVMFNVACELSQPIGKTGFSSTAKNRTKSVSYLRKCFFFLFQAYATETSIRRLSDIDRWCLLQYINMTCSVMLLTLCQHRRNSLLTLGVEVTSSVLRILLNLKHTDVVQCSL